jgi:CRISPR-associated exonuclease Cas4
LIGTEQGLELTVTELKQFAYCPRIPYYHYVLPVEFKRPYKMARGKDLQGAVEAVEKRRGYRKYGIAGGERLFGFWLRSERLGLAGKLDLLIRTSAAAYPVDFKDTEGPMRANLRVQLGAYALLVEDALALPVPVAFVYFVPKRVTEEVAIDGRLRERAADLVRQVRSMVADQRMPEPTDVRARCTDCEYRNDCGDIW